MCTLKGKTKDSYLPTHIFTFSSKKPFSMPVLILTQIRIVLLIMIHIWHWIGRTFCNLRVADIWFMPAKAFPQEEVFWLISIAISWGHFPFCDLIRPHNKTEPNMFGIWLGHLMKTGKKEWREALPGNQQGRSVLSPIGKWVHVNVHEHLNVCKCGEKPNYLLASTEPCAYCLAILLEMLPDA